MPFRAFTRFILLAGALTLASCRADQPTSAFTTELDRMSALPASCDVSGVTAAAGIYLGTGGGVTSDIDAIRSACLAYAHATTDAARQAAQAAANDAGFSILSRLAAVAGGKSSIPGLPAVGGGLVVGVLEFMSIGTDTQDHFAGALGPNGMFQVRGAGTSTTASRGGRPEWRIKTTWPNRVLVYGYETTLSSGGAVLEEVSKNRYDISRLPASTAVSPFIAYCTDDIAGTTRIQHRVATQSGHHEFLSLVSPGAVCSETIADGSPSMLSSAARLVARLISPRALWANTRLPGGVGGFGSDLSPFFVASVTDVGVGFVSQPEGYFATPGAIVASEGGGVKVRATTGGAVIPNAVIVLSVGNNSGVPAGATLSYTSRALPAGFSCPAEAACETVAANGIADFTGLMANKPGGYTLRADVYFDGIANASGGLVLASAVSNRFQLKQAKP